MVIPETSFAQWSWRSRLDPLLDVIAGAPLGVERKKERKKVEMYRRRVENERKTEKVNEKDTRSRGGRKKKEIGEGMALLANLKCTRQEERGGEERMLLVMSVFTICISFLFKGMSRLFRCNKKLPFMPKKGSDSCFVSTLFFQQRFQGQGQGPSNSRCCSLSLPILAAFNWSQKEARAAS